MPANGSWLPYYRDVGGRVVGYDIERIRVLAAAMGVDVKTVFYPDWPSAVQAVCDQKADVVLHAQITAVRTQCLAFTQSWGSAPYAVVARNDRSLGASAVSLRGRRIACETGWAGCADIKRAYPAASMVEVPSTRDAQRAVAEGRADVYIGDAYIARQALAEGAPAGLAIIGRAKLPDSSMHDAVSAQRGDLAAALDKAARGDAAATLVTLRETWLKPVEWPTRQPIEPTEAETTLLSRPWTVGVLDAWPPLAFMGSDGQVGGVVSEYMDRFGELGVQLTPKAYASWADMNVAMRRGDIDFVIGLPKDEHRATPGWMMSEPFLSVPVVVVMRADRPSPLNLESLSGYRVLVSDFSRLGPQLAAQAPHLRIESVATLRQGLDAVDQGQADAYIGDLAAVDRLVRERYIGRVRVVTSADISDRLVLAARGEAQPLLALFNRMVADIPPAEKEAMEGHWFVVEYQQHGVPWRTLLTVVLPVALLILFIVGIYGVGFWRLRREAAQRRRVERQLDEVAANLPAVVFQLERETSGQLHFIYVLGDVEPLFGISREVILQDERQAFVRIHEDDRARLIATLGDAADHFAAYDVEFRTQTALGERWIRSVARPIRSEQGSIVWNGYWVDVTTAHEHAAVLSDARAAAEQATVAKAEFLATMSHEIRTPMSGVLGMMEILAHSGLNPAQAGILETMENSAHMLRQLLDDILDYSRIEKGALTLENELIDLGALVRGLHATMQALATRKGLAFTVKIDRALAPALLGDGLRVQQVLSNLVTNAIKFTEAGTVAIGVEVVGENEAGQHVVLTVADTGIGISPDAQAELFQPFTQAEGSTTRRFGGSGLGLSICRRLVSLMGGTIDMDSEQGSGTTLAVVLSFAIADAASLAGKPAAEIALVPFAPGYRALVAEDHVVGQRVLRWRLDQLGLSCHVVADGIAALEILAYERFDVLITDCQMPLMDGYALATRIRGMEAATNQPRLPILALTAGAQPDELARCREAGMDRVLTKPVDQHVLHVALAAALEGRPPVSASASASASASVEPDAVGNADADAAADAEEPFGTMARRVISADVAVLDQAIVEGDVTRLAQVLHRMGGALGSCGLGEVAEGARRLEELMLGGTEVLPDDYLITWRERVLVALAGLSDSVSPESPPR